MSETTMQSDSSAGRSGFFAKFDNIKGGVPGFILPVADLCIRLYIAKVFFLSGLTKAKSMSSTIALFENEYSVPLLPADVAAYLATAAELLFPVLLLLGLAGRFAGLSLFVLNVVAWHSYAKTDFASTAGHIDHLVWMLLLAVIVARGPGQLSIDHFFKGWWKRRKA